MPEDKCPHEFVSRNILEKKSGLSEDEMREALQHANECSVCRKYIEPGIQLMNWIGRDPDLLTKVTDRLDDPIVD